MRDHIRFLLNGDKCEWPPSREQGGCSRTLLDELRVRRRMTGTKEGCAEGDCGACTVLVGRLARDGLRYETVNACIRLMGSLDGCHVVTIEHLRRANDKGGAMHPVQQAMIEHHGSQCGFCTPGIVMSLYSLWMANPDPSEAQIETALQGNLCRCTGYAPIVRAAQAAAKVPSANDALVMERARVAHGLAAMRDGARIEIEGEHAGEAETIVVPTDAADLATVLAERPDATIVSGSTDVGLWVAKHMRRISPAVFVNGLAELQAIETGPDGVTVGAGVTYSDFAATVAEHFPQMAPLWHRIGGEQVRNMGTVGGNIANGSPIGDTPPALIVLGAKLTLRSVEGRREMPLEDFFLTYGKQDRRHGEFVESIHVPYPASDSLFGVQKISKRREEDISTLCGAFHILLDERNHVSDSRICYGGMAGTPKRALHAGNALRGRPFDEPAVREAIAAMERDYEPMSDQRASAAYRMAVAKNLLLRFYLERQEGAKPLERLAA